MDYLTLIKCFDYIYVFTNSSSVELPTSKIHIVFFTCGWKTCKQKYDMYIYVYIYMYRGAASLAHIYICSDTSCIRTLFNLIASSDCAFDCICHCLPM